ncbi:MAG: TSUP family transporter [Desulfobacteraceae bacterium]|nr:TSUP family transporter [Desulfobacteraceae bacterium]
MVLPDLTFEIYLLLFGAGLFAGFVDSVAGGGGLISLPALMAAGIPPHMALGVNKLQGSFGTLSAAYNYMKKSNTGFKQLYPGIVLTLAGAVFGAMAISNLDPFFLKHIIPVLLFIVLIYTFFAKNIGRKKKKALIPQGVFYLIFGLGLGFYDGFFGPGTGSFWTAAYLVFLGQSMTLSVGYTKVMNFTSNIVALTVFIIGGNVLYGIGLCMAAGQIAGARIGSNLAIEKGVHFIRPLFLCVVFVTLLRMLYQNYMPS